MKTRLTFSLVASLVGTAFAGFQSPLPEFKNEKQLAEWRAEKASEATGQGDAAEETAFYTGKPYLASSGGYAFKYRSYNPELARWTSEDPSGFPDGANQIIYAPTPTSDPDVAGLLKWSTLINKDTVKAIGVLSFGNTMNRISSSIASFTFAIAIGGTNLLPPLTMAQEAAGSVPGDIKIGFRMAPKNQLFLDILNLSDNDRSVSSNIGSVVSLNFQGFPKGWTLQLRSTKNAVLKLKAQGNDGWMDPFIYSSSLVSDERMKEADVIGDVIIRSKSTFPYAIEYKGVLRLIESDIPAASPKAHEFRVRCNIKLIESGKVIQKELLSEWFPVKPS